MGSMQLDHVLLVVMEKEKGKEVEKAKAEVKEIAGDTRDASDVFGKMAIWQASAQTLQ